MRTRSQARQADGRIQQLKNYRTNKKVTIAGNLKPEASRATQETSDDSKPHELFSSNVNSGTINQSVFDKDVANWDMLEWCEQQLLRTKFNQSSLIKLFNDRTELFRSLEPQEKVYLVLRSGVFKAHFCWSKDGSAIILREDSFT